MIAGTAVVSSAFAEIDVSSGDGGCPVDPSAIHRENIEWSRGYAYDATRTPESVWNREELYQPPKTRRWDKAKNLQTRSILIESELWKGKPTWVFAHYGIPEHASSAHPAPGIVLVHGGQGTAYPSWVATWVQRGYAAICVDNCGSLPVRTADGKWLKNPEGGPTGWGRLDLVDEPEKEQWMYHAVAAVVRSHSFLRSLPEVDAKRIGITGISWGGILTCISAAVDERFAYAIPVYGCGFNCDPEIGIMACRKNFGHPDKTAKWFSLWDPANYLPFAKCPFLWVDGTNDFAFKLENVRRSADLLSGQSSFATIVRMIHSHGVYGENQPEIFAFADHYANGGRDIVRFGESVTTNGVFSVPFDANGRNLVRAEFIFATDEGKKDGTDRYWNTLPIEHFDSKSGVLSVAIPESAKKYFVNLIDYFGLIASTPLQSNDGAK